VLRLCWIFVLLCLAHRMCRGVWSPGDESMFSDLPIAMREEISMAEIYPTLIQVTYCTRDYRPPCVLLCGAAPKNLHFRRYQQNVDQALSPSGSAKCLRFGHWLTLCTLNMLILTYLLTYLRLRCFAWCDVFHHRLIVNYTNISITSNSILVVLQQRNRTRHSYTRSLSWAFKTTSNCLSECH